MFTAIGPRTAQYGLIACSLVALQACQTPPAAPPPTTPAQVQSIEFRAVPEGRNPSGCRRFDAAFSRVHTLTKNSSGAAISSAGGINVNLTEGPPSIYTASVAFGGISLNVDANAGSSPKTLVISDPRMGCRWAATTP